MSFSWSSHISEPYKFSESRVRDTKETIHLSDLTYYIVVEGENNMRCWWLLVRIYSHVVGEVVFFLNVRVKTVRHFVEIIFTDAADETIGFHVFFDAFQLITQLSERVNDQTFNTSVDDIMFKYCIVNCLYRRVGVIMYHIILYYIVKLY